MDAKAVRQGSSQGRSPCLQYHSGSDLTQRLPMGGHEGDGVRSGGGGCALWGGDLSCKRRDSEEWAPLVEVNCVLDCEVR